METASTRDFYEASFYLLSGATLEAIEVVSRAGALESHFVFTHPELPRLQREYLAAEAVVNLYAFRRAYTQVQSYALDSRRRAAAGRKGGAR